MQPKKELDLNLGVGRNIPTNDSLEQKPYLIEISEPFSTVVICASIEY